MILVDIGNTRLKWSVVGAAHGRDRAALSAPQFAAHDADIAGAINALELPQTDAVWVASVMGPSFESAIEGAIAAKTGVKPAFARVQQDLLGLRVAYPEPQRLGVDRWLTMLGLWHRTSAPFCVAGAGTALTFDAVSDTGEHLGGFIGPGLTTALNAVANTTRFEIRPGPARFAAGLGTDTESCVRQGALHACVGAVDYAARDLSGARFLTGGDAGSLLPHLGKGWEWRPNAVLEGLLTLATHS